MNCMISSFPAGVDDVSVKMPDTSTGNILYYFSVL